MNTFLSVKEQYHENNIFFIFHSDPQIILTMFMQHIEIFFINALADKCLLTWNSCLLLNKLYNACPSTIYNLPKALILLY